MKGLFAYRTERQYQKEVNRLKEESIGVSVYCTAYNHEKYIRKTLEGFVHQTTNFNYEIIVHDDASTDGTADIIREYEVRYPDMIRPIYQVENQYSQGKDFIKESILPLMRGKYVAVCEGDDYWFEESKLQQQYDALENNPSCFYCVHKVNTILEDGAKNRLTYPSFHLDTGIIKSEDFIPLCMTYNFHTCSYFFHGDYWREYIENPPEYRKCTKVGDKPYMLHFGQLGDVYYIDQPMSCYRIGSIAGWNSSMTTERYIEHFNDIRNMIKKYDLYTDGRVADFCREYIDYCDFQILVKQEKYKECLKPEYRYIYKKMNVKSRIFINMNAKHLGGGGKIILQNQAYVF